MEQLQQQLEELRTNHYKIDSTMNLNELSSNMLENIGATDGYLRDTLIYTTFYHLIHNDHISHKQLQNLLSESISEQYLFYNIHTDD